MSTLKDQATRAAFRSAVAAVAASQVGTAESPAGSNNVKYGLWFNRNRVPWCAMFVSWVYDQAAGKVGCENPIKGLQFPKGFAGTVGGAAIMTKRGWRIGVDEDPMVGDVVIWRHTATTGHTGIITKVLPDGSLEVTEGNTSPRDTRSRNGGEVAVHHHPRTSTGHGQQLGIFRPTRKFGP